jgi:glyoxylase-like metal-dependent hydrolase (beta-lactamase superfamily II)
MRPHVTAFFDEPTFTVSYVAADPTTGKCAIIDPVLDYDPASGSTETNSAEAIIEFVRKENLAVEWILETHVHADHLTAAPYLKDVLGGETGIGFNVSAIQETFAKIFNVEPDFKCDGSQFDTLFNDGDVFHVGDINARAMHTPGHTPACMTYLIGDAAFVGDTLFMPDYGTARTDFPGGDARTLFQSIRKILAMPNATRLFMCHDYKAPGRDDYRWETTVGEQKKDNIHIHEGVSEEEFVAMRAGRDRTLSMPRLLLPSVQVNMRAGQLPPAESNGVHYLKMPVNQF